MDLYKKKLFSESLKDILLEDIYGNKAFVYHRTRVKNLVNDVYKTGFTPGSGDTYGKAFYSTYELESQLNPEMIEKYGDIIVKFMINSINRFMFFDYDEFLKSPIAKKIKTTKDMFIIDQLKYFEVNKFKKIDEKEILRFQRYVKYTSDIARYIRSNYNVITKLIDGMVFTGSQDGKVLLSYNTDLLIPLSFSDDDGKEWKQVNKNLDYLKKIFSKSTDYLKTKELKTDLKYYSKNIKKNTSSDAIYTIDINNDNLYINWEKGIWNHGDWMKGTWKSGTWKSGRWKNGIWESGDWLNGTWESGDWLNGTWWYGDWGTGVWHDGIWKDGIWKIGFWKKGTWEKGTWEYGFFEGGTWKSGTWLNGNWNRGIWKDGIWKKGTWEKGAWLGGTWENGKWLGGIWKGGYDKNGNYHPKGDSPDKWSK